MSSALPINNLITPSAPTAAQAATAAKSGSSVLGPDAFLKLLTTQLQSQDPLNPMDDTQSVAQLAQFTSVQSLATLSSQFTNFQQNFQVLQSASLVGKSVTVSAVDASGNTSQLSGTVNGIQVLNGVPEITMKDSAGNVVTDSNGNPALFATTSILGIGS